MPMWLMVAAAVLVGAHIAVHLIWRRSTRFRARRLRRLPLAAAAALLWMAIGPGPSLLRALTAASGVTLMAVFDWWFGTGREAIAAYRRALRRNAQVLPAADRAPGVVVWLVLALVIATVGLLAANAAQWPLFRPR